jgi:hypothetical protein
MTETMTPGEVMRVLDDCASKLDFHYRDTRSGDEMRTAFTAVAALISERDGYKAGWWEVVEMLGGKKLDISNAQYHASVIAPKIRELIARNAELEAERNEWKLAAWKARDERDAETTRANAMRENAERYLWLRNESICYPYSVTKASPWCVYGPDSDAYPSRPIDREELDAAVDAARAEGCGNG